MKFFQYCLLIAVLIFMVFGLMSDYTPKYYKVGHSYKFKFCPICNQAFLCDGIYDEVCNRGYDTDTCKK